METLIYLGKVNLYWILLYGCYWLLLRNHTFFQWNRFFLLGSLATAFALPFVIYPETAPAMPGLYSLNAATFTVIYEKEQARAWLTWENLAMAAYAIGLIIASFQFAKHILSLRKFLGSGEKIELDDCNVILTNSDQVGSFSFLRNIVINRNDYEQHFDAILRHEMVHTRQLHSLDIIFLEVLKTIFWFNPVLLLYKKSMQEVHEFLADRQAPNREHYARFLVAYALNAPIAALTNHFFKPSQIKTRIKMIYKNRSSKWMLGTYFLSAMLITGFALMISACEQQEADKTEVKELSASSGAAAKQPGKVYTVVEEQPEFPGGIKAMYAFLADNITYPKAAVDKNIEGRVFLAFVVTETGEVQDIQILKGLGYGCDAEAVRVLKKFPKWVPGKQSGEAVRVRYNLPINFQLTEKSAKKASLRVKTTSGNEPVLYVDGVRFEGKSDAKLHGMDPDKIESMEVFKGEKALKKFGEGEENGVILVTTKK